MGQARHWTAEEIQILEDNWGILSYKAIGKRLGRSPSGVQQKGQRLGLGDPLMHFDGMTLNVMADALNTHYAIVMNWVKKYGFPVRYKKFTKEKRVKVVLYEDFWKWAAENRHMIDFSRTERGFIGVEPDWVEAKRNADRMRKTFIPKPHNTAWTEREVSMLLNYTKAGMTYPELQRHLKRSEGAIKRKFFELGIKPKDRPKRLPNHNKYTAEEEAYLIRALNEGRSFEEISNKLGRSSLGIRGKAERMGYSFRNGKPYKKES